MPFPPIYQKIYLFFLLPESIFFLKNIYCVIRKTFEKSQNLCPCHLSSPSVLKPFLTNKHLHFVGSPNFLSFFGHAMRALSFPTRDQTHATSIRSAESTTGPPGKSLSTCILQRRFRLLSGGVVLASQSVETHYFG